MQTKRLFCDSFVLSVKADDERIYCGLNNGCVQVKYFIIHQYLISFVKVWNFEWLAKVREQECHDKGVKCIDINNNVILTGSYDATFKVSDSFIVNKYVLFFKTNQTFRLEDRIVLTSTS